ncbi:LysR family transcriptional regulator [Rubellimicrobium arenae]|uniref:LysR family transcriptional regulator n=1 Tax=Rubellimicrobium arenae TaxID=2817372 RepID=UPI001B3177B8|nr:LysR family transcriptional regulator [Rubellimicrobium arenae]
MRLAKTSVAAEATAAETPPSLRLEPRIAGEITIRRLQVFWAIAHTTSLTKAAKLLGLSQPSLSQQLASLEAVIGGRLFDRTPTAMALTELGTSILGRAEAVLRSLQEFEDCLPQAGRPAARTIRIAGVSSALRCVLPGVLRALRAEQPQIDFDLIEAAPAEILDLLYARRASLGLLPANAVAEAASGFRQELVAEDPYVLAVPAGLDLSDVQDPMRDLTAADRDMLHGTIQFAFGTQHSQRLQDWYDQILPGNRLAAQARSFELVIEMVRSGLGVGVVPALSAMTGATPLDGVRLHRTGIEPRRIVAMFPAHSRTQEPYAGLLAALREAGSRLRLPPLADAPPFLAQREARMAR